MPTWLSPHGPSQDLIETESKKGTARLRWWQELNQAAVFRRKKSEKKKTFKELGEKNVYLYDVCMYVDLEIHLYYLTPVLNLFELFVENLKHPEILISKAPPWRSQFRWQNNWKHAEGCQGFCPDGAVETDFCYVAFLAKGLRKLIFHGKAVQSYHVCLEIQTRQLFQMGWFRGLCRVMPRLLWFVSFNWKSCRIAFAHMFFREGFVSDRDSDTEWVRFLCHFIYCAPSS